MSTKRVTITLDNIDGLDLFFKLMREDVNKTLATHDVEAIKAKLTEVQASQVKLHGFYKREIKKSLCHNQRRSFAGDLYRALMRISAEQFNLVLAKLIAGLKDCVQK